jgi:hypothetical protein
VRGLIVALSLVLTLAGCGGRRIVASTQPITASPRLGSPSMAIPSFAFRDVQITLGAEALAITSHGELWINGVPSGRFTPDGGFFTRTGREVARLLPDGRMTYQGTLQDSHFDGPAMIGPRGPIVYVDANGQLFFTEAQVTAPATGITGDCLWTVLYAVSMFGTRMSWAGM